MADSKKNPWGKKFNSVRNLLTTTGVVEFINTIRGSYNASYAWITTEKEEEISVKLAHNHDLVAGQQVSLTQSFSEKAYRIHSTEIKHPEPVLILGTAKYVNQTRRGWAIAITTRSQRRMRRPLLKYRTSNRPNFRQGQMVSFFAKWDMTGPVEIASDPKPSNGSLSEKQRHIHTGGVVLPDPLCEWLSDQGVNAIHQAGLHGKFPYVLESQHSLGLLEREEKTMRDSGMLESENLQAQLKQGLHEVRFIRPRDNASIRRLRDDLLQVDQAGLQRWITVLVPVHDLSVCRSFRSTCQTLLLKPGFLNIGQIKLLDRQQLTFPSRGGTSSSFLRLAVIRVSSDTKDGRISPAVQTDASAPSTSSASQKLWLKKHSAQAVKFLLRKGKAKEVKDRLRPVARVVDEAHEMDRHFTAIVATFNSETEAVRLTKQVAASKTPVFMAPAFDYYYGDLGVFNVITTSETPASFLYEAFEAEWVYPVSRTRYRFGTHMGWTKLMRVVRASSDRLAEIFSDGGYRFEPKLDVESESEEEDLDGMLLKLTGFPSCVGRLALTEAIGQFDEDASEPLEASYFSNDGRALMVTVNAGGKLADLAGKEEDLNTDFGPIAVQAVGKPLRAPVQGTKKARHESMNQLLSLFGPLGDVKESEEREDQMSRRGEYERKSETKKKTELEEDQVSDEITEKQREELPHTLENPDSGHQNPKRASNTLVSQEDGQAGIMPSSPNCHTDSGPLGSQPTSDSDSKGQTGQLVPGTQTTQLESPTQHDKRALHRVVSMMLTPSQMHLHEKITNTLISLPALDRKNLLDNPGLMAAKLPELVNAHTAEVAVTSQLSMAVAKYLTIDQLYLTDRVLDELHKIDQAELMQICESPDLLRREILNTVDYLSEPWVATAPASPVVTGSISEREKSTTNTPTTVESASAEAGNKHGPPHSASEEQSERQAQVSLSPTLTTSRQSWAEIGESADEIGSDTEENKSEISCDDEKTTTDEDSDSETSSPVRKKLRQRQNQRGDRASGTNSNE